MKAKSLNRVAATLVTVGGVLVGLASAQSQLERALDLPPFVYTTGAVLGMIAVCLGGALVATARVRVPRRPIYICVPARPKDLPVLRNFAQTIIDAELLSVHALRAWQKRRPDCHQLVFKVTAGMFRTTRELVGFFTVVPVTMKAKQELEKNELRGFRIEPKHIVGPREAPAALYVSAIGAKGWRARENTLMALKGFLAALASHVECIYTRPVTEEGLRLARQHGFKPVTRDQKPHETVFVRLVPRV
ncbi:MAG TPA: hypothetical protein VGB24_05515 [Longimicrobium sp.]|jgi:hypothetical protein|uniref:hypothetical protein n=1 Tax=Longimicrobium sp. TaxID=2029185 RepID=UPI002EDB67EA